MRVHTKTCISLGCKINDLLNGSSVFIEKFLGMIALEPVVKDSEMLGLVHCDGNLVSKEVAFDAVSVNNLRTCPSLGCTKNDHGPYGTGCIVVLTGILLDRKDALDDLVHGLCHLSVHGHGIVAFNKVRLPAVSMEEIGQFLLGKSSENGGVGDLVSV